MRSFLYKATTYLLVISFIFLTIAIFSSKFIYGFFISVLLACVCDVIVGRMEKQQ